MTSRDSAIQQNLVDLLAEIDKLQVAEDQLSTELAQVRTRKSNLLQLVNVEVAIGRLPDEVLAEVFRHLDGGWDNDNELPFLLRASQVTKRWRHVTLSIPSLWSTIELRPNSHSQHYQTRLVKEYLSRSGASLLDIEIHMCEDRNVTPVVDLLIPEIDRWLRLVVESTDERAVRTLFRALHNQYAPRLQHLRIDVEIDDEQNMALWIGENRTLAGGVPSLNFLETRGINMHDWLPPLGGVKSIYMADCYSASLLRYHQFRQILIASTSLTHLELEGMIECSTLDDVTLIEMPCLVLLSVLPPDYVNPIPYMRNIFTTISAPSLQILCLRKVYGQQFRVFLETFRSASYHPVLETLMLDSVTGLEHLTPTFALSSPTIRHLSLKFTDPAPILQLLTNHNFDPLWPLLQTLTVGPVNNALLRSFISDRISIGLPLVKLRYGTELDPISNDIPTSEMNWFVERLRVEMVSYYDM
jgi:hypothetical protein